MSSRTCPDWPQLMEVSPDLQFKHYSPREAELPAEVVMTLDAEVFDAVSLCCDLAHHVYNPEHTDARLAAALGSSHWLSLADWVSHRLRESA